MGYAHGIFMWAAPGKKVWAAPIAFLLGFLRHVHHCMEINVDLNTFPTVFSHIPIIATIFNP
jgi:hypothetical protein